MFFFVLMPLWLFLPVMLVFSLVRWFGNRRSARPPIPDTPLSRYPSRIDFDLATMRVRRRAPDVEVKPFAPNIENIKPVIYAEES